MCRSSSPENHTFIWFHMISCVCVYFRENSHTHPNSPLFKKNTQAAVFWLPVLAVEHYNYVRHLFYNKGVMIYHPFCATKCYGFVGKTPSQKPKTCVFFSADLRPIFLIFPQNFCMSGSYSGTAWEPRLGSRWVCIICPTSQKNDLICSRTFQSHAKGKV